MFVASREASSEELQNDDASSTASWSLLDATPRDPFEGLPIEVPYKSRPLFQLCFLHAALLMTSLQWTWSTGISEQIQVSYLYHKLQAIRFVNDQLAKSEPGVEDGVIAAIASLALVEVSLSRGHSRRSKLTLSKKNCLGSADAVAFHLRGLIRIKQLQRKDGTPRPLGLFQRVILMATRRLKSRPPFNILDIMQTDDIHQSVVISLLSTAIRPMSPRHDLFALSMLDDPLQALGNVDHDPRAALDSHSSCPMQSVDKSRSDFLSCYFYLYIILQDERVDSFVLNWFLEQLLADVCRTQPCMQKGQYSQTLWFWTVMFGACATVAAKITSATEEVQMRAMRDAYMDKINLASQVLRIKSWEAAKTTMRLFAWEDDFDGEDEIKGLWEEAVWADGGHRPKVVVIGPGFPSG
ncbi:hypothetical protein PFICI_08124 [Pestalotiopsis fici W106-1]|uniref:Transcription factor domain-containing protein n=1 Tax=Pestalotiopsis fici (strain W106-1 / CGMCC3.15140) TaxID=1229662 RepID=W3X3D8_PESFW|nr:uncharacterized protein PFICI_08124 [Pestalotiopsis fici W106-1]ETS80595.1 hypothetical protein PFICI_08124 [Pestalotiopsis fici W106-1]